MEGLGESWRAHLLAAILCLAIPITILLILFYLFAIRGLILDLYFLVGILLFDISVCLLWRTFGLRPAAIYSVLGATVITSVIIFYSGGIASTVLVAQTFVVLMAALLTSPLVTVIVVVALSVFNFLLIPFAQNQQFSDLVLQDGPFFRFILQTAFIIISAGTILYSTRLVQALVQNLVKSEYRFRALFEKTSDAVFIANMDLCLIEVNEQAARLLAYPREELSGLHIRSLFPEDEWTDVQKRFSAVKTAVALPPTLRRFVTKTGTELVLETNLSLVQDQDGNPLHYQSTGRDVTQKYLEEQRIKSTLVHMAVKASTDALTGILNRETVSQHAEAEWERYDREGQPLSLMLVDMDGLKRINDTHGHNSGDAALNTIARLVEQHKRPYDWFGRYGGDEFLLVLPGTTLRDAQEIARRMRAAVSKERVQVGKKRARLSASFGVASTDGHQPPIRSVSELIKLADVALYKEKRRKQKD